MKHYALSMIILLLLLQHHVKNFESVKILCIFHTPIRSHFMTGEAIAKGLLEAYHELKVIHLFYTKNTKINWRDIELSGMIEKLIGSN